MSAFRPERAPDLITDDCESPCGCWELNSGPLEKQAMLLTTEPSLQPQLIKSFKITFIYLCGYTHRKECVWK